MQKPGEQYLDNKVHGANLSPVDPRWAPWTLLSGYRFATPNACALTFQIAPSPCVYVVVVIVWNLDEEFVQ